MHKLIPADLHTSTTAVRERDAFKARALAHRKIRTVHLGSHLIFMFDDRLTVQLQLEKFLAAARSFEPGVIAAQLDMHNPRIPDGTNLKAMMLIEYTDATERATKLAELHGIERRILMHVGETAPIVAVLDDDCPRSTDSETSLVHFLRFEFTPEQIALWRGGADVVLSVDHPVHSARQSLTSPARCALAADFD